MYCYRNTMSLDSLASILYLGGHIYNVLEFGVPPVLGLHGDTLLRETFQLCTLSC
jgi:hypothetical protein